MKEEKSWLSLYFCLLLSSEVFHLFYMKYVVIKNLLLIAKYFFLFRVLFIHGGIFLSYQFIYKKKRVCLQGNISHAYFFLSFLTTGRHTQVQNTIRIFIFR